MPRGSHLTDIETVEKRTQKRADNKKELYNFFVHINHTLRVTRDNYNIVLISKRKADSGRQYAFPEGYYSVPADVVKKAKEKGASEAEVEAYLKKVKGIVVSYDFGNMEMTFPKTYIPDVADLEPVPEE